jgi:hypothetical protein
LEIILEWIFKKWDVGMDLIALAQDKDRQQALVSVVVNPSGSTKCGEFD